MSKSVSQWAPTYLPTFGYFEVLLGTLRYFWVINFEKCRYISYHPPGPCVCPQLLGIVRQCIKVVLIIKWRLLPHHLSENRGPCIKMRDCTQLWTQFCTLNKQMVGKTRCNPCSTWRQICFSLTTNYFSFDQHIISLCWSALMEIGRDSSICSSSNSYESTVTVSSS